MKFSHYLQAHDLTPAAFAAGHGLGASTVHRAVRGKVTPSPRTIRAIVQATGGAVTANDFIDPEPGPEPDCGGAEGRAAAPKVMADPEGT